MACVQGWAWAWPGTSARVILAWVYKTCVVYKLSVGLQVKHRSISLAWVFKSSVSL